MNPRTSFLVLGAILFIVSQLMGEGSTIVGLASTDTADFQDSVEVRAAAVGQAPPRARAVQPVAAVSMDDFYGAEEVESNEMVDPDTDFDYEPVSTDAGGDNDDEQDNGVPFNPVIDNHSAE